MRTYLQKSVNGCRISVACILGVLFGVSLPVGAQTVTTTVPIGTMPNAVAVNPVTNKIYVANFNDSTVTVMDGKTGTVDATVGVGSNPAALAVNPETNKIYVAAASPVIDGATNATSFQLLGTDFVAVAVNPVTDKIYFADFSGNSVLVLDGPTGGIDATVPVGQGPVALAVNPVTNKIYVANLGDPGIPSSVTVIDGTDHSTQSIISGLPVFFDPSAVAVNPVTNRVYVANSAVTSVTVIDGATVTPSQVPVGVTPTEVAVNPVTNKIYVVNSNSNDVTVIDGATGTVDATVSVGLSPSGIAVNTLTNQIYVSAIGNAVDPSTVTVIDGATNTTTTATAGVNSRAVAVNPVTNKAYVANWEDAVNPGSVTVIDGATNATTTVTAGAGPRDVAVNPVTNKIYVPNENGQGVSVIDGVTGATTAVTTGLTPVSAAVNVVTNKVYVANAGSDRVAVIDGAGDIVVATVVTGLNPVSVAVNPSTDKIYVVNNGGRNVAVIDGPTDTVEATIDIGISPLAVDVNLTTNKVYVISNVTNTLTVIDGTTNTVESTVSTGSTPQGLAVNSVTNRIYTANSFDDSVTVVDGVTNSAVTIPAGDFPIAVAVNPVTNKVYVANKGDFVGTDSITVIDGEDNSAVAISTGAAVTGPTAVAVNPVTNKIYFANRADSFSVLDGVTNTLTTSPAGDGPIAVSINPVTGRAYVANQNSNDVTVIDEQDEQAIPLTTSITPFPGNVTLERSPTIAFTTASTYAPVTPAVQQVYFQIDTWQGEWIRATGTAPNFTATAPLLNPGQHVVYAYATDGQDSTTVGKAHSFIGQIAAYAFTVVRADTTTGLVSDLNPAFAGDTVNLTAHVSTAAGVPTGTAEFFADGVSVGTATLDGAGDAIFTTASLPVGTLSLTAVYRGDDTFNPSTSPALTQVVDPATLALASSPTSATIVRGETATFTLTVTQQGATASAVSFSCAGLPQGASCSTNPATVAPGTASATVTLSITTARQLPKAVVLPRFDLPTTLFWALALLAVIGLPVMIRRSGRLMGRRALATLALGMMLLALSACGGGRKGPTGTFPVTVTANGGNVTSQSAITLTINK